MGLYNQRKKAKESVREIRQKEETKGKKRCSIQIIKGFESHAKKPRHFLPSMGSY